MRTSKEMLAIIRDVMCDVYDRPSIYGPTALEVDCTLGLLHWFASRIEEREKELAQVKSRLATSDIQTFGTFARAYWKSHYPPTDEGEGSNNSQDNAIAYVCESWRRIADAMESERGT
jgi:hypothetical protein